MVMIEYSMHLKKGSGKIGTNMSEYIIIHLIKCKNIFGHIWSNELFYIHGMDIL